MNTDLEKAKEFIINFFLLKGVDIIGALIMLAAGFLVARWVGNLLQRWLDKRELEPPVRSLAVKITRLLVMAFVAVIVLGQLGVPIAPMIAGIGVVGVGIGLAMQGLLSNVVAGLMIVFLKPFRVGEYIEIVGVHGVVSEVALFTTKLEHADLSRVIVPNRKIVGEILHNYGAIRQLDLSVGVAYDAAPADVLTVVREILANNPRVLKEPAPVVGIAALADSAINIAIKPWVKVTDLVPAAAEINQAVVETFRQRGIAIPFPQREVRLLQPGAGAPAA